MMFGFGQMQTADHHLDAIHAGLEHLGQVPGLTAQDLEEVKGLHDELERIRTLTAAAREETMRAMAGAEAAVGSQFAREVPRLIQSNSEYVVTKTPEEEPGGFDPAAAAQEIAESQAALLKRAEAVLERHWPDDEALHWPRARVCLDPRWGQPAPQRRELADIPLDELLDEVKRRSREG